MNQAPQAPARLIFAGRTISKLEDSIAVLNKDYPDIDYRTLRVDLSSQSPSAQLPMKFFLGPMYPPSISSSTVPASWASKSALLP